VSPLGKACSNGERERGLVGSPSPRTLILGGTGQLGHKLFQQLLKRFPETMCTMRGSSKDSPYCRVPLFQAGRVIEDIDVLDGGKLERLLLQLRPDFIVNCIGVIKQRDAASSHIETITINSLLPHQLAKLSAGWGGRLIHFSTDCVFSGRRGMYKESDLSDAEDLYGKTKFLGETLEANALTIRTSIIGRELVCHHSLLDWFLSNEGGCIKGYRKSIYSGVTTNHLAEVVTNIIFSHPLLQGIYQVASDPINKYELLCLLRDAYSLDVTIEPVDGENLDRSMDGSRFRQVTGYICPTWPILVEQLAADLTPYEQWLR
jgi:dTDP-4-dehydrorhamnose reductase